VCPAARALMSGTLADVERLRRSSPYVLAALLALAGMTHLVRPQWFDGLVPPLLPGNARTWTVVSGVVELLVAAAVAVPRTRRGGGLAAAALFLAVFPGNIQMALDAANDPSTDPWWMAALWLRLPLQVPLIWAALRDRRR